MRGTPLILPNTSPPALFAASSGSEGASKTAPLSGPLSGYTRHASSRLAFNAGTPPPRPCQHSDTGLLDANHSLTPSESKRGESHYEKDKGASRTRQRVDHLVRLDARVPAEARAEAGETASGGPLELPAGRLPTSTLACFLPTHAGIIKRSLVPSPSGPAAPQRRGPSLFPRTVGPPLLGTQSM